MLTRLIVWLSTLANSLAGVLLAPVAWLPGWLSVTLIAMVTGIVMLLIFKVTSNQTALKRTRNHIKANLLALSLFKDDLRVGLRAQGRLLGNAGRLLLLALVPMLVMLVPMSLLLGQLARWYQTRPLAVGGEAVVTVQLARDAQEALETIAMTPSPDAAMVAGPVRVPVKHMVCWNIRTREAGRHQLHFTIGQTSFHKELVAGNGFMPTSVKRPAWHWSDALWHPGERPFPGDSLVQSIEIAYPRRASWTTGSDTWLIYWFLVSMLTAFIVKPIFKVNL